MKVGLSFQEEFFTRRPAARRHLATLAADAGIDYAAVGDHVALPDGRGFDGLLHAAVALLSHDHLDVVTEVYLLALRSPLGVARQVSSLCQVAPGRFTFGVGLGGNREETAMCGVDPATRGAQLDEHLEVVRMLLTGERVSYDGRFVHLDGVQIEPAPARPFLMTVGGRSDAALRRTGRFGDGWVGVWLSPRRFGEAIGRISAEAAAAGRSEVTWDHGLQVWCGFDQDTARARARLAADMERFFGVPFERYERHAPSGTPEAVAEHLAPYLEAGCTRFSLVVSASSFEAAVEGAGEVRRLLG